MSIYDSIHSKVLAVQVLSSPSGAAAEDNVLLGRILVTLHYVMLPEADESTDGHGS